MILLLGIYTYLKEYPPHPPSHPLFLVNCVEHVDELVEIVGGLHHGPQQRDQGHVVTLGVELGPEPVRLQDWKSV